MDEIDGSIPENDCITNTAKTHRSLVDIKHARETRTSEALRIKDEQIRILSDQNNKLLEAIEKGEEEISAIQIEKLHVDDENRTLRESNFTLQSKAKVAVANYDELKEGTDEREQALTAITSQHKQVVSLLEKEEEKSSKLSSDLDSTQIEVRDLKVKHSCIANDLKSTREDSTNSSKQCELQSEEIRLLRSEVDSLKSQMSELTMKSSVEIESLQEQLRVRKEKQYQLLERLQSQEEARRQAEDEVSSLEEKMKNLQTKSSSTATQLQLEISSKLGQADLNKKLSDDNERLLENNKVITLKLQKMDQDQTRMETEARENGEQLREMAEKVFQLLERLKLAELGKTRSMEALRSKEDEVYGLKKKLVGIVKEHGKEVKLRTQIQAERSVLEDQIRDLKKHNLQLGQRCKEEARLKVKMDDGKREAEAKIRTLNSRLSFLLNKLQADEEARGIQMGGMEKLQGQIDVCKKNNITLQNELEESLQKGKETEECLRKRVLEFESIQIKLDAVQQLYNEQDQMKDESIKRELEKGGAQNTLLAGGRLRFFIDSKPSIGLFALKGKSAKDRDWLEKNQCNVFMKKASKSKNKQDMLLHKIAETYGVIMTREEDIEKMSAKVEEQSVDMEKLQKKLSYLHERLETEEESKRRTLLKYINAVKASVSLGEPGCEKNREEVGSIGAGKIQLPEACIGDEEVHAICAMLRENQTIMELNLRGNLITDEGCRALASVLSAPSALEIINLRKNRISRKGIKLIVEALERSTRVRNVHVHAGGKVEAFGQQIQSDNRLCSLDTDPTPPKERIHTICIVDIRENSKPEDSKLFQEEMFGLPITIEETSVPKSSKKGVIGRKKSKVKQQDLVAVT